MKAVKAVKGRLGIACALTMAAVLGTPYASAEKAVRARDGDSIEVRSGKRTVQVRLADIDAPELAQPHGKPARSALDRLVRGKQVRLELRGGDRYQRVIAVVHADGRNLNRHLVRRGHAWVRREYNQDPLLERLEDEARAGKRGLWKHPCPTAPWKWRKASRKQRAALARCGRPAAATRCGSKRRCKEMTSCAEARHYFSRCGVEGLDGDGDGKPCEQLCS